MVNIPIPVNPPITLEDYLVQEDKAQERHEFTNGTRLVKAADTSFHAIMSSNIAHAIRLLLGKDSDRFLIMMNDVKVWIEDYKSARYPDILVIADEIKYHGKGYTLVTNPHVIVEVLSSSTQAVDEGIKFEEYRSLESLEAYILVHQNSPKVSVYSREETDLWRIQSAEGVNSSISVPALDIDLALSDVYAQIAFGNNT